MRVTAICFFIFFLLDIVKLHSTPPSALHAVTGCGPNYVEIDKVRYTHSVFVSPNVPVLPLPSLLLEASTLPEEHFEALRLILVESDIDILLIGSPYSVAQLYVPLANCIQAAQKPHIGLEMMDFRSACGTYNILIAENKKVAAALWLPEMDSQASLNS